MKGLGLIGPNLPELRCSACLVPPSQPVGVLRSGAEVHDLHATEAHTLFNGIGAGLLGVICLRRRRRNED